MDSIRSILVHVDGGRHSPARLEFARALAAHHEARLQALFAVTPRYLPLQWELGHMADAAVRSEIDQEHRARAKAAFDRATGRSGWPMTWQELVTDLASVGFAHKALHADLLVLGQRDPADADAFDVPADFVESVVLGSGKPAIIVPSQPRAGFREFDTVLIAWQPTREAAKAMADALPLLQRAREVHLVVWMKDATALAAHQQDVLDYLRLHAVDGVRPHSGPVPQDTGAALLALADGLGADLLVMGCYGHSRARELVMGGASSSMLRDMRLPVLMAH